MRKVFSIIIILGLFLATNGCKKYEEGPGFSLASKKGRLVNVWKVQNVITNQIDVTDLWMFMNPDFAIEFKKDETWAVSTSKYNTTGKWSFDKKKEKIFLTTDNSTSVSELTILKLKKDELWTSEIQSNTEVTEIHFITK